jgi:hypothetical protein
LEGDDAAYEGLFAGVREGLGKGRGVL